MMLQEKEPQIINVRKKLSEIHRMGRGSPGLRYFSANSGTKESSCLVYSLLIIVYSLLISDYSLLIIFYSLLISVYSLLFIFNSLLIIVHSFFSFVLFQLIYILCDHQ